MDCIPNKAAERKSFMVKAEKHAEKLSGGPNSYFNCTQPLTVIPEEDLSSHHTNELMRIRQHRVLATPSNALKVLL